MFASRYPPAIDSKGPGASRKVAARPDRTPTREELELENRSLDIQIKATEKEVEYMEKVLEIRNLKWELELMDLEEEKGRVQEELDSRKAIKSIFDSIAKYG